MISSVMLAPLLLTLLVTVDGSSVKADCSMYVTQCEFYLDIDHWLAMRLGWRSRAYVSDLDGKIYKYHDTSNETVSPDDVVLADGSDNERVLSLFNKTLPGPSLIMYEDQGVIIHVTNNMMSNAISVHWHGIQQRGTPWMDGPSFVTQCPILPGQSFTYRFKSGTAGTHFYHAHTGMQMGMGLMGAFIVKKREENALEEHIMMLHDYNNHHTELDTKLQGSLGYFFEGGEEMKAVKLIDGTITTVVQMTSMLINGRGRLFNGTATEQLTRTPLSEFKVEHGKKYRFRVINSGQVLQQFLAIDGHTMTIVAMDGNDLEPYETDFLIIHIGERFDFILEANANTSDSKSYWIRTDSLATEHHHPGFALLKYIGAADEDPTTSQKTCTMTSPCTVINCPMLTYPNWTCVHIDELKTPEEISDPVPVPTAGKYMEVFLNFGIALHEGKLIGHINGVSNKLPRVSSMTQPREVYGHCDESHGCGVEKYCSCHKPLDLKFKDVIQLNMINFGRAAVVNHPIHMHGYEFHVLKIGYRQTDETFGDLGDNPDITCNTPDQPSSVCNNASWSNTSWHGGNIPGVDWSRSARKDTITIPGGGYAVIRFVADNPGLWFMHCHLETHNSALGMGILLNDSFDHVPQWPSDFPECRSYPPPDWLKHRTENADPETTTTATASSGTTPPKENTYGEYGRNCVDASDGRAFSGVEFWVTSGVLVAIIVLQFLVSTLCLARRHNTQNACDK